MRKILKTALFFATGLILRTGSTYAEPSIAVYKSPT
jgi:hypothetical protein